MFKKTVSILVLLTILAATLGACGATPEPTAAPPEAQPTEAEAQPPAAEAVTLQVWGEANEVEHWRVDGPVEAAKAVTDFAITVEPLRDDAGWADYKKKFTLAADAGEAPDIVLSGHEAIRVAVRHCTFVPPYQAADTIISGDGAGRIALLDAAFIFPHQTADTGRSVGGAA